MSTLIQLASKEFDGTDYVYVYADGTPSENGEELRAATQECKINWNLTGRRQTVLVGPGAYSLNFDPISIDGAIDITGISSTKDDTNIIPGTLAITDSGSIYANFFDVNDGSFANDLQDLYVSILNQGYNPGPGLGSNSYRDTNGDTIIVLSKGFSAVKINTRTKAYQICSHSSSYNSVFVDKITGNIYTFEFSGGWKLKKFNSAFTGFDPSFTEPIFNSPGITSLISDSSGSLYARGFFSTVNGFSRNNFVKLQSNGSLDPVFNIGTGFNSNVTDFALDNINNQIIVVGFFNNYNGNPTQRVARLDKTTGAYSLLPGQTVAFNNFVLSVDIMESNGYIIFSGYFSSYNGGSYPSGTVRTDLLGGSPVQFIDSNINPFDINNSYYDIYEERMYLYPTTGNNIINGTPFDLSNSVLKIKPNLSVEEVIIVTPGLPNPGSTPSLLAFTNSDGSKYILYPKYLGDYQYFPVFIDGGVISNSIFTNTISNMIVKGPILTDTNGTSETILRNLTAYYVKTYDDFYNPSTPFAFNSLNIIDTSVINLTFSRGNLTINSSEINQYQPNNNFASSNITTSVNIFITKSKVNNFYSNQTGINIQDVRMYDTEATYAFNGLTTNTYDPGNSQYLGSIIYNVIIENCRINYSFSQTIINSSYIKDSILTNDCFVFDNGGSIYHVGFGNYNLEVNSCTINNTYQSFIFTLANYGSYTSSSPVNFGPNIRVNGVNITNNYRSFQFNVSCAFRPSIFFNNVNASLTTSCMGYVNTLLDGNIFQIYDYGSSMKCTNCFVTNEQGQVADSMSYTLIPDFANGNYDTSNIIFEDFQFINCSATAGSGNDVTGRTLNISTNNSIGVDLTYNQVSFINCSITSENFNADSFLSNIRCSNTGSFRNIQFKNCNVATLKNSYTAAFLSNNLISNLTLDNVQFINCSAPSGFLAEIQSINVYLETIVKFIECSVYVNNYPSFVADTSGASYWNSYSDLNPLLYFENCSINSGNKNGFVYSKNSNSTLIDPIRMDFIQCTSRAEECFYKGFPFNTLAIIHASFCKSANNSFGNQYFPTVELNFSGNITHCSMGPNSLGTNSGAITASGLVLNLSNTSSSIASLSLYSGSLNV